ncbi:hypothetical protein, partial [Escherichia coli]|uniref:hypothetical protein n=1 Tax=Escherichia coli TaxID=562 RepID=UPI001A7E15C7
MTRSLELRVCIAHKSIPALVEQGMKYCCRMALHAEAQRHRVCRLLTKSALFMPDAAQTPYPTYKNRANSIHCRVFVGLISGAH